MGREGSQRVHDPVHAIPPYPILTGHHTSHAADQDLDRRLLGNYTAHTQLQEFEDLPLVIYRAQQDGADRGQ